MFPVSRIGWGTSSENVLAFGWPFDLPVFGRQTRPGSRRDRSHGGAEDSWIVGRDFTMRGDVRWIPNGPLTDPVATPWGGPLGVQAFRDWCGDGNTFRLTSDTRYPNFYIDGCRLVEVDGDPTPEQDATWRLPVVIGHPTVDLALAVGRGLMFEYQPGASLTDPLAYTMTRPDATTCASYVNADPLLQLAAANVLRDRHYVNGLRTTLLERAATNGWTKASQFNDAAWIKTRCSITANAATAPDGTTTGDKVVEDATASNTHDVSRQFTGATNNTKSTAYVVAASAGRTWLRVTSVAKSGAVAYSWVNLATGAKGTVAGAHTITVRARPNGWYRVDVTYDVLSGASTPQIDFSPATGDGVVTYTGDGTSGIYLWRAGVEIDQPAGSSEVETDTATVTRALDTLTVAWPYRPQAMWSYRKFVELGTIHSLLNEGLWGISESTGTALFVYGQNANRRYVIQHDPAAGLVESSLAVNSGPAIGDTCEILTLLYSDGSVQLIQSVNGGADQVAAQSAAVALDAAWTNPTYRLGGRGPSVGQNGITGLIHAKDGAGTAINTMALARAA